MTTARGAFRFGRQRARFELDRGAGSGLPPVVDAVTRFVPLPSLPRFAAMGR
jgi:hypothetical protein